jgi:hypothetical protein
MKAKRKKRTALLPLSEVIARDARNKRALETQFLSFYAKMKKVTRGKSELRAVAHGVLFGTPMVTVEEKEDWDG